VLSYFHAVGFLILVKVDMIIRAVWVWSRVGQKKFFFEIQKKGFFNPDKSAKNIF